MPKTNGSGYRLYGLKDAGHKGDKSYSVPEISPDKGYSAPDAKPVAEKAANLEASSQKSSPMSSGSMG